MVMDMVFLVEKWEDIEDCLRFARYILYTVRDIGNGLVEVRVKSGRLGYVGIFGKGDKKLKEILTKLESYGAIRVTKTVPDELFLS